MKKTFIILLAVMLVFTFVPMALAADDPPPLSLEGVPGLVGIRVADAGAAPAGERNRSMYISLPLVSRSMGPLYDVSITPVVTTNIETFPFAVAQLDYTVKYPGVMQSGAPWDVAYTFTVGNYATRGIKQVDFAISYRVGSATADLETMLLPVFVNITRGYSPSTGTSVRPMPKLIVEKFSLSADRLFAGETFTLTMYLRNTSTTEGIRNLEINLSDPTGTILPGGTSSGTMFIDAIGKDETVTQDIVLQSAPDAEARAYTLGVSFSYDGASSRQPFTAETTITLPISQRIRIKADEPASYGEPWAGQPYDTYMNIYNMGKSTVYNCAINVDGPGMSMFEPFFGGNIGPGSSIGADFSLLFETGGEVKGDIVVSYEDVYGEVLELRVPFERYVNGGLIEDPGWDGDIDGDHVLPEDMPTFPVLPGARGNGLLWILIGAAVVIGGGLTAFFLIRKKRRANSD